MKHQDYMQRLVEKWNPLLNEESCNTIKNPKIKASTALMMENQDKFIHGTLDESSSYGSDSMNTAGGYSGSGIFHQIAVPMVRRTFPELIAHEIVGVQPLNGPVGIAFALRYKAGQAYDTYAAGQAELGHNTIDSDYSLNGTTVSYTSTGNVSAAEALGSKAGSGVGDDVGLGIGSGTHINEVTMTIEKQQVEANTRKLRSRWSLEVAQDIKAMHGLDMEKEMMDILSYEITAEIDRELISTIKTAAVATSAGWDYDSTDDADGRWEAEKYRNLYNRILRDANNIAITTRRGAGNFVIANPTVSAVLETLANFAIWPVDSNVSTAVTGVSKLGMMDGRMTIYRDTFATVDEYVVGFKGISEYDSGVIYLPYIQLMQARSAFEDSFNPAIGLMSRYAIHNQIFGAGNYYRHVRVKNLPS